jgi:hypothetical protein
MRINDWALTPSITVKLNFTITFGLHLQTDPSQGPQGRQTLAGERMRRISTFWRFDTEDGLADASYKLLRQ